MPSDFVGVGVVEVSPQRHPAVGKRKNRHLMEKEPQSSRSHERWAHFRFSVIGALLAAPPPRGQLQSQLQELALKKWRHPISGEWICFGLSTIERWYYKAARSKEGPVDVLNHLLKAAGNPRLLTASLIQTLCEHAAGNLRLLMNMANDLLAAACHQEREQIDEKLYFEVFALDPKPSKKS